MKVDGITLLQMIKDGKIKDNTKIKEYYLNIPSNYILEVTKDNLIWKPGEFTVGELWDDDYTFEILEEKPKKIEELPIKLDEFNDSYYDTTLIALASQIEEIREAVNYLLKKEDKKEPTVTVYSAHESFTSKVKKEDE